MYSYRTCSYQCFSPKTCACHKCIRRCMSVALRGKKDDLCFFAQNKIVQVPRFGLIPNEVKRPSGLPAGGWHPCLAGASMSLPISAWLRFGGEVALDWGRPGSALSPVHRSCATYSPSRSRSRSPAALVTALPTPPPARLLGSAVARTSRWSSGLSAPARGCCCCKRK